MRSTLAPPIVAWAEWRASSLGIGADRVLIAEGFLDEESYVRRFCLANGVGFEPLSDVARTACPLSDAGLLSALCDGILPLRVGDEIVYVIAPCGTGARHLARLVAWRPELRRRVRLTSARHLHSFITMQAGAALGSHAADALRTAAPALSASTAVPRLAWPGWPPLAALIVCLMCLWPETTFISINLAFSVLFLSWMLLRLLAPLMRLPRRMPPSRVAEADLPVYTVIAALYREARSVPTLVGALKQFDWPAEKLDIKLVVEADDVETQAAIAALDLDARFEMIVAPAVAPRTKPKALNAALPFARGTFTVIYDAEDRPEPDQLRVALDTFLANDATLACVQAALTIDNTDDSWLARMFTAEYAAHFDVLLPCLSALRLPLPLGGSSNHFRTAALRAVGAWDPHNVTEDADLGIRLARCGYRSATIASTTHEEAPADLRRWLHQRTRWFKGWMQTSLVHMRTPSLLLRELGLAGFATFQLIVGGSVLAALVYPIFLAVVGWRLASGVPLMPASLAPLHITVFIGGLLASAVAIITGLRRRNLLASAWIALLAPLHWLLLSLAAWRALLQFMRDPFRWEKTEHGLARSSRTAPAPALEPCPASGVKPCHEHESHADPPPYSDPDQSQPAREPSAAMAPIMG